jgi:ABC transporter substrate binding protein (PQQ-dependent alcohol dehydrogenase system)
VLAALIALLLAPAARALTLGYLELDHDPRYDAAHMALRLPLQPLARPFGAARESVHEARFAVQRAGGTMTLKRVTLAKPGDLNGALDSLYGEGVRFFLLDLPDRLVAQAAAHLHGGDTLLFNLTALGDDLRRNCRPGLLHTAPSEAMLNDALAQYLVSHKWRRVLLLTGPSPEDAAMHTSFLRSAKRFGLRIVGDKPFVLGKDPRQRARNNVALLTGGPDYDLVVVLDDTGEFAQYVPYQTLRPRPVAGSAGLVADWWHWAWLRHGAPQLNNRILRATGHLMEGQDWSAWVAVKAISGAVLRTNGTDPATLRRYLLGNKLVVDGFKGYSLNFRPWDGQLRQPIFLTTRDAVVAVAPLAGFLHPVNNLDTLGLDAREVSCTSGDGG